ncbi:MAG: hypothetical protein EP347_06390, partial [Alphaproteobacteria bacterium]
MRSFKTILIFLLGFLASCGESGNRQNSAATGTDDVWQIDVGGIHSDMALKRKSISYYDKGNIVYAKFPLSQSGNQYEEVSAFVASEQGMLSNAEARDVFLTARVFGQEWKDRLDRKWGISNSDYGLKKVDAPAGELRSEGWKFHPQLLVGPLTEIYFLPEEMGRGYDFILCVGDDQLAGPCIIMLHSHDYYIAKRLPAEGLQSWREDYSSLEKVAENLPFSDLKTKNYRVAVGTGHYAIPAPCFQSYSGGNSVSDSNFGLKVNVAYGNGEAKFSCDTKHRAADAIEASVLPSNDMMAKLLLGDGELRCRPENSNSCRLAGRIASDRVGVLYLP